MLTFQIRCWQKKFLWKTAMEEHARYYPHKLQFPLSNTTCNAWNLLKKLCFILQYILMSHTLTILQHFSVSCKNIHEPRQHIWFKNTNFSFIFWKTIFMVKLRIRVTMIHKKFLQAIPRLLSTFSRLLMWHKFSFTQIFTLKLLMPPRNIHHFYLFALLNDSRVIQLLISCYLRKTSDSMFLPLCAHDDTFAMFCCCKSSLVHVKCLRKKMTLRHTVSCVLDAESSPAW
jgi:hypothetical protein